MGRTRALGLAVGLLGLTACGGMMVEGTETAEPLPQLSDVTDAQWAALARRQIFFGHQSVGYNIMDGVADVLAANPRIALSVVESRDLDSSQAPAFRHAAVGRNAYPVEKMDDFLAVSTRGLGAAGGIGMVKLCFEDVGPTTNADSLFAEYRKRMEVLRARHPGLTIVHLTMPLTVVENWRGYLMKKLRGAPLEVESNAVRNRYNALLLQTYQGREPVFDLARLESTLPDGRRTFARRGSDTVYVLAPRYTEDGGHLNADARRMVAEQLLITLAGLEPSPAVASRGD